MWLPISWAQIAMVNVGRRQGERVDAVGDVWPVNDRVTSTSPRKHERRQREQRHAIHADQRRLDDEREDEKPRSPPDVLLDTRCERIPASSVAGGSQ